MNNLVKTLPVYEPKIDNENYKKVDLNIRDLQTTYTNGCICCGTIFYPKNYSRMIANHFNTNKHKNKCLIPANELLKEECGNANNIIEAFENKCKENRELKKLNYIYKDELDKLKLKYTDIKNILEPENCICENLIDL